MLTVKTAIVGRHKQGAIIQELHSIEIPIRELARINSIKRREYA
jgi:hypothetical protein